MSDLLHTKYTNAKDFWRLLRGDKPKPATQLSENEFGDYFKSISNPTDIVYNADENVYEYLRNYNSVAESINHSLSEGVFPKELTIA